MTDRITLLIKAKNLSAAQFADEIGVQRSSISHLMSGRNKPSLDLIQKTLQRFPEVSTEWLLFGKGEMVRELNLFDSQLRSERKEPNEIVTFVSEPIFLNQEKVPLINRSGTPTADPDIEVISGKDETTGLNYAKERIAVQSPNLAGKTKSIGERNEPAEDSNQVKSNISGRKEGTINQIIVLYDDRTFITYSSGN